MHHQCPSGKRGRRECRVFVAPAALRASEESTQASHHRYAETFRHSLHDGLRLIACSPRGAGLDSPRRLPLIIGKLDPSVGRSGPHAFTVRFRRVRLTQPKRPSHPAANVRDDRDTPLSWSRTREEGPLICPTAQAKFLRAKGWMGGSGLKGKAKLVFPCARPSVVSILFLNVAGSGR